MISFKDFFDNPFNRKAQEQASRIESDLVDLQSSLYRKHTFDEVKTKFEEVRKELGYSHDGLRAEIMAGRVDLFANPPLLPPRPELTAADVKRIMDELKW